MYPQVLITSCSDREVEAEVSKNKTEKNEKIDESMKKRKRERK